MKSGELTGPESKARPKSGYKRTAKATQEEAEYMDKVASFGCILSYWKTGISGTPCVVHHVLEGRLPGRRSSHFNTIGLAPRFHQYSKEAIHDLGYKAWSKLHGVSEKDLLELTRRVLSG